MRYFSAITVECAVDLYIVIIDTLQLCMHLILCDDGWVCYYYSQL